MKICHCNNKKNTPTYFLNIVLDTGSDKTQDEHIFAPNIHCGICGVKIKESDYHKINKKSKILRTMQEKNVELTQSVPYDIKYYKCIVTKKGADAKLHTEKGICEEGECVKFDSNLIPGLVSNGFVVRVID